MISKAKITLYNTLVWSTIICINGVAWSTDVKPISVIGMNIKAWAKIIGITFAAKSFKGMYWRAPPNCWPPTTRLAYCTGIFLVPCTNNIAAQTTNRSITTSTMNIKRPPPLKLFKRATNSWPNASGRRAIIPIMMINDTPLPMPLSVIRSPNQRINILPAARIIVEVIMKVVQLIAGLNAPADCIFRFVKYAGACTNRISMVK